MSNMSNVDVIAEERGYYSEEEKKQFLKGLMKKEEKSEFISIFGDTFNLKKELK